MAIRSKKTKSIKKKKKVVLSAEVLKQIRHLETDLKYTLRAIGGKYELQDLIFTQQAEKIKRQISKLKEL